MSRRARGSRAQQRIPSSAMTTRPVIGLTMDSAERADRLEVGAHYVQSIEKAGGLPLAIPFIVDHALIPQIVDQFDGILFIGGDDLDPSLWGEEWHPNAVHIDPQRQNFELALLAEVEKRHMPTLGICLGCQLLNVYRGGSLHQFLPDLPRDSAIEHRKLDRELPAHAIRVQGDSQIGKAIGKTELEANTYHKQAANKMGRGLRVVATSPDGVIEAFEDPNFPLFAAVQWHPERLNDRAEHLALFELLVDKARETRAR